MRTPFGPNLITFAALKRVPSRLWGMALAGLIWPAVLVASVEDSERQ